MNFQISPLSESQFKNLNALSSQELSSIRAVRMLATKKPGFPCRVSLQDAEIGEEVILVHHEHQAVDSPFRSSHAVFIRPGAPQAVLKPNEVPEMLRSRTLSLRGFDTAGMMTSADLTDGQALEPVVEQMFENADVAYIHIHFAKPGCYAARIDRL